MLLRMNGGGGEGSDYGSSEAGSYEYDEEGEDDYEEELEHHLRVHHHEHPAGDADADGEGEGAEGSDYDEAFEEDEEGEPEVDPADFEDDEAYARALQDAEEREVAARLMALAGLSDCEYKRFLFPQLSSHFSWLLVCNFSFPLQGEQWMWSMRRIM